MEQADEIPGALTKPFSLAREGTLKRTLLKWRRNSEEQRPRNIQRADIVPTIGYAMIVDGHFKTQFSDEGVAKKAAKELLASYPMLKVEVYDASAKVRT